MTPATLLNQEGDLTTAPCARDNQLAALAEAIGKADYMHPANDNKRVEDNYPDVVAFTGVAGSGKSTAAQFLVDKLGYTRVRFAQGLKDMMRVIGATEEEIEGSLKETPAAWLCGKTPRQAMQALGTAWGRDSIGEDFWLSLWRSRANKVIGEGGRVVTDDCRFPNEAAAIRKFGGDIFKIEGRGGIAGGHMSEAGCGIADAVIDNGGELDSLHKKVVEALERYG
jgi:hypothetical protein